MDLPKRDNGSTWDKFGPIWPMTPPVAADFPTWVNQGTSTCIDNKGAMFLSVPNGATAMHVSCRMKAYPTPPFTVEMAFIPTALPMGASNLHAGFVIRDSVSGKMQGYGAGGKYQMQLIGANYFAFNSICAAITGWPAARELLLFSR